jgi:hypothetical protein
MIVTIFTVVTKITAELLQLPTCVSVTIYLS